MLQRLRGARELGRQLIKFWPAHCECEAGVKKFFQNRRACADCVAPVVKQVVVQIDFDRAGFGASAAER
jgi:hypothetical protein